MLLLIARAWASLLLLAITVIGYAYSHELLWACGDGDVCPGDGSRRETATDKDGTAQFTASTIRSFGLQAAALAAQAWPFVQPVGMSGIVGYACGLLARKVLQVLLLGAAFIISAVQALAYLKWVTVHWDRIDADLAKLLGNGSGEDGTGTGGLDASALLAVASERLATVLSQGLPSVAGFTTGLTLAFMPGMALV
ncbi:hypothetical protein VOLCADRAFT_104422 [Volvox carteri f. nagariensis]|uniref:Uncharacterized protein n=1 Tax=Volvox carteri f. nagariensis TaxID=3068 RepID=D8TTI4_VOLCA|nr:uncharacterized protein VOLCADRAFT_104422 [Volvox carteri f. nagariensis]EFJ49205.1 hypothetical protein VOLCADRAFT_104422 [Volvox carteri f. nagariensis]|eukprot:XP_002949653.1 hypothetical protein VOLCADRAFT_104422 [Volvox carteri f. nagariensis]